MADPIISVVVEQLANITVKAIGDEVKLVRGVKEEVSNLSSKLENIQNVLEDAERKRYKEKGKEIQSWLHKLEETSYDIADVLDEWNYHDKLKPKHKKVCPFIPSSCSCLGFQKVATRRDIAKKIKGLNERMDTIVKEKNPFGLNERMDMIAQPVDTRPLSTSFVDVTEIQGRAADKDALLRKLMVEECVPSVIAIAGAGGIGKTTLSQQIYNDDVIKKCFNKMIWICVSNESDDVKVARGIVEKLKGSAPNLNELDSLLNCVADSISGEKFLLVLDDVWGEYCDTNKWEPLKNSLKGGAPGSKILITTRSERVARIMGANEIHHLGLLSETDCCSLMRRIAFSGRSEKDCEKLKDISWKIASKCKGLPLAAKVLGSHLRFKDTMEEWENVLNSEIWKLEKAEVDLFPHLLLSYNELSPAMKRCFSFCAFFPKDYEIDIENLIRMWMALGYLSSGGSGDDLELRGKEYIEVLKARSLIQYIYSGYWCTMHDIIHDFAQFLRKNKSQNVEMLDDRVSCAKIYRSLLFGEKLDSFKDLDCIRILTVLNLKVLNRKEIQIDQIGSLIHLRYLDLNNCTWPGRIPQAICKLYNLETLYLSRCELKEIPKEIGNLIQLRHLDLSYNGELKEIPKEIGNLIHLRHLDLSTSKIKELPETIYNLHQLRTLNLTFCYKLEKLHEGIDKLVNLKQFMNEGTKMLTKIPQGLEKLTGLRRLDKFYVGRGWNKWGHLNKLNKLSGELELHIKLHDATDVIEARKAELINKVDIKRLNLRFIDERDNVSDTMGSTHEDESVRNDFMWALQPPPNLHRLTIDSYKGNKFPGWITTSLNHLKVLKFQNCNYCSALPPLWKLPCLEKLSIDGIDMLQSLGREFTGMASSEDIDIAASSSSSSTVFPKLETLKISNCRNLKEWEDITAEEEENTTLSIMPCLRRLTIDECVGLTMLPHRLIRKASSLKELWIKDCIHLVERYSDCEDSTNWKSLSHIELVDLVIYDRLSAPYPKIRKTFRFGKLWLTT